MVIDESHSTDHPDGDIVSYLRAIATVTRGTPEGRATYIEASRAVRTYVSLCLRAHAAQFRVEPLPSGCKHSPAFLRLNAAHERLIHADRNGAREEALANFHEALADLRHETTATCRRARQLLTKAAQP